MKLRPRSPGALAAGFLLLAAGLAGGADRPAPGIGSGQAIDEAYTRKIREYTTDPSFSSPLVDYLPASPTVPTPESVLKDVAGAPGILPYTADVHRYMRMLAEASPRVKVRSIGTSEEGREMIAVTIASEKLLAGLDENRERLSRLADPRSIRMDEAAAARLIAASTPVYYITGTIHSPETGAPTALMELAYRLAVDESPYIRFIREHVITMITPVVEVDGRDRQVDVYRWHLAHPGQMWPPLVYWGHYVAHDNNRDAMGLSLNLTRNVLAAFVDEKAQVLHDLHESVPFLYDNTAGDGPFNAWLDPILTNEWEMLAWQNVHEMTRFGMPGVFTHGTFDTWSPNYLMFVAASHNGISRLYETFGNGGADTVDRELRPEQYARAWYRQNPPLPRVKWSQRDNNNYEETGLLTALSYFGDNAQEFLKGFYEKARRSIEKPRAEGPAAYVFPSDDPRLGAQAELLRILQLQRCEVHHATAPFTVTAEVKKKPASGGSASPETPADADKDAGKDAEKDKAPRPKPTKPETRTYPAGTYVVRMDQPYSRIADMLLDYQYWSPKDPQKAPYDDTGWTFGELFGVKVGRVSDLKVLDVPMERVTEPVAAGGGLTGTGRVFAVPHNADNALATLRFRFRDAAFEAAEEPFQAVGKSFPRGTFLIQGVGAGDLARAVEELGLKAVALDALPAVRRHPLRTPRIALVHTWLSTQDEGWWRIAFEGLKIPYQYLSTQDVAKTTDLRARFDVILFPPVGRDPATIVAGIPTTWGNSLPWKKTAETPNLGTPDATDDLRPGLTFAGLEHLRDFVARGGLLVGVMDSAELAVGYGLAPGLAVERADKLKLTGSVVRSKIVDAQSPILYGYTEAPALYSFDGPIFEVSHMASGRGRRRPNPEEAERPTGRGTSEEADRPVGRAYVPPPEEPKAEAWQPPALTADDRRNNPYLIPPRWSPRVVLRYGDTKDLLISGLLEGGKEIAQHPAVVDVPVEEGHVVLFSNNPIWRGETRGNYFLVFNAILNFDHLDAGRKTSD